MRDLALLALGALRAHRLRTALSMLGTAIGVAAVILLTSIGEGTRAYIVAQFTQFETSLMSVNPGKSKTVGIPGVLGGTTHKLTIDDAEALARLPGVRRTAMITVGMARVEAGERGRSVYVYGTTPDIVDTIKLRVRVGSFWTVSDPRRAAPFAVLGPKLSRELFGDENPLGRFVRIAGTRFRVIGVMEPKGQMLGIEIDDMGYVPAASALRLFNQDELLEIHVLCQHPALAPEVEQSVRRLLTDRHGGNEDFTVTSQRAVLAAFDNVMRVITMAVGAIAGISLLVGATGVLTVMWIAVGERTAEIGLARAVGATRAQIQTLFLAEAAALATLGGMLGLGAGLGIALGIRTIVPGLPLQTPAAFILAGLGVSFATGLIAGIVPARRAAGLDPVEALRAE